MLASILISSYNRLPLFKRTLYSIVRNKPNMDVEVIVCDDGSTDDILGELKSFSTAFPWTFIRFDSDQFTEKTGLKKYFNNPSVTNNICFRYCKGDYIFQQGNEIMAWDDVYNKMIADAPKTDNYMVMSTTYDVPMQYLSQLDSYGSNLTKVIVNHCKRWPLQSKEYRSDVTNYICLASRNVWESLQGYDERYFAGISAEDSDFVRRARTLPGFQQVISDGISLHQYHGGKTMYYDPQEAVIQKARFDEGCKINRVIYDNWDGTHNNKQTWDWGTFGVKEVVKNGV